ncbi:MAG: L-lactate dehydrogenase [Alphaproteobacteria bacterium]|mgnify:FL=1|nr:L-lactate dehydrogenase [Alphaproteobacteria bacterium]MAS45811.1 L-lactate dehydrogenase [Alphaproteobacteria bacterium]MAX96007.1 L-lactate dehydrogenase [Alphaproteobacteria bacterium]MBN53024.1 L-lactate dehydrogenase [Alphaproteobacteria bacterium]OUT42526.1 MAG: L-lactate dehydrogenase [Micavibrio sp. TMED2]|tara:strand:- start:11920 stop:12852 length:933 start_codon:yes stop_codon:yes gene_type:complete
MKIGIIGTGMVGSAAAFAMAIRGIGSHLVLVDHNSKLAAAQAQDIAHAVPFGSPIRISHGSYEDLAGAAIVVLTAGVNQKPGETRLQLLDRNVAVFEDIITRLNAVTTDAILLIATNPVDIMTYVAQKLSGLAPERVIGSGTILDTARFRSLLGDHLELAPQSVHAYVMGEHGDSEVLVWSNAIAGSVPVADYADQIGKPLDKASRDRIDNDVRRAAYKIIEGKGSTYYGIGAGVARICRAIIEDEHAILSVSMVTPEIAGITDVPLSLPRVIGRDGILETIPLRLDQAEAAALKKSATIIRDALPPSLT